MTLRETLEAHLEDLRERHTEVVDEHVRAAYDAGVEDEQTWLSNLGIRPGPAPADPGEAFERIRYRTQARVEWYDQAVRAAVLGGIEGEGEGEGGSAKADAYQTLAELFDEEAGLTVDRRGETEEVKWVNPDGSAGLQDRDVFWTLRVTPEVYYDWATANAVVEARNVGRVQVQLGADEVMGHVWVDPLDELTTPMAARLHGETFGRDGLPFYPPITEQGRSRIWPVFQAASPAAEKLPSVDELVDQRERWFANYSRMQRGELPDDEWASEPVDLSAYNVEFIYRQLLPRNLDQYLPSNAE